MSVIQVTNKMDFTPLIDQIKAAAVENGLQIQELKKMCFEALQLFETLNKKMDLIGRREYTDWDAEVEGRTNNDPIVYPEESVPEDPLPDEKDYGADQNVPKEEIY